MSNVRVIKLLVIAALTVGVVGCSKSADKDSTAAAEFSTESAAQPESSSAVEILSAITPQGLSELAKQGEALFESYCADCHPRTGRGHYLKRIPATLLARRSQSDLVEWIRGVDQHRDMPSFIDLSAVQLEALAAYLSAEVSR